jgi:DNA replication and repair protein RecF
MFLESIYCKNFRNFRSLNLDFFEGRTLIVGDNNVGKTNLIEMIYFLSTFSSFRTQMMGNLVLFGENFFTLSGTYGDVEVKVKYSGKKEIFIDGLLQKSVKEAFGAIPVVALTNEDVEIINGGPGKRRYFMNISISLYDRKYLNYLYEYRRVKKQRNKLLFNAKKGGRLGNFELWEKQLIKSIYPIVEARSFFIKKLSFYAREIFKDLTGKTVTIKYVPGADYNNIEAEFNKKRQQEIETGYTLLGPHRDEIMLEVENRQAKEISSFGIKKLLITSLKMGISRILTEIREEEPVLLIDEMLGGLDRKNSDSLTEFLKKAKQVLITTTNKDIKYDKDYNKYIIEEKDGSPFVSKCAEKIHTF